MEPDPERADPDREHCSLSWTEHFFYLLGRLGKKITFLF